MIEALIPAWQGALETGVRWLPVLALASLTAWLLRRRPARERHAVWAITLASLATLPLLSGMADRVTVTLPVPAVLTPVLEGGMNPGRDAAGEAVDVRAESPPGTPPSSASTRPGPGSADRATAPAEALEQPAGAPGPAGTPEPGGAPWSSGLAALLWAAGTALLLGWELLALGATSALARGATPVPPEDLPEGLGSWRGDPPVLSGGSGVPILFGLRHPRILLPDDWRCWPEAWQRAVILHERGHARRFDIPILSIGRLIRALFWFHPGSWLVFRELKRESERATDERVLASDMDRFDYAEALLGLARYLGGRRIPLTGLAMAAPGGIQERLLRIARADPAQLARSPRKGVLSAVAPIAVASLLAASLGAASPAAYGRSGGDWLDHQPLADGGVEWRSTCSPGDDACATLTDRALRLLRGHDGGGAVAVQEVTSGRVLAYAFVDRDGSHAPVPAVPVSAVAGMALATAWWEAGMGDRQLPCPGVINPSGMAAFANTNGLDTGRISAPDEVLTMQCATAAIAMGWYLDDEVGPDYLPRMFARWGFAPPQGDDFWAGGTAPEPASPSVPAHPLASRATWIVAGSVHGTVRTTPLHLTRFLQAVASRGRMTPPAPPSATTSAAPVSYMEPATADRLIRALEAGGGDSLESADPTAPVPLRRIIGVDGPSLLSDGGHAAETFAGLALDSAGAAHLAVAVWLPRAGMDDGVRARPDAARSLAHLLLSDTR